MKLNIKQIFNAGRIVLLIGLISALIYIPMKIVSNIQGMFDSSTAHATVIHHKPVEKEAPGTSISLLGHVVKYEWQPSDIYDTIEVHREEPPIWGLTYVSSTDRRLEIWTRNFDTGWERAFVGRGIQNFQIVPLNDGSVSVIGRRNFIDWDLFVYGDINRLRGSSLGLESNIYLVPLRTYIEPYAGFKTNFGMDYGIRVGVKLF